MKLLFWTKCLLWPVHGRKVQRPYLASYYSRAARLRLLIDHYNFMFAHGLFHFSHGLKDRCTVLARFNGKSGTRQYNVVLAPAPEGYCEGELLLNLTDESRVIYWVSFSFVRRIGGTYLQVGCIQGGKRAKELIATATRELYGCCPRFFMTALVRGLSQRLGCAGVILVGNSNRVIKLDSNKVVHLDYNQIWNEIGAHPIEHGDYFIGHDNIWRQEFSDLPSKKRSEARKKAALLKTTIQNTGDTLLNVVSKIHWLEIEAKPCTQWPDARTENAYN